MKNYLSFGGGVNSVAMMLLLLDEGVDFEAIFVDHGTDWHDTYIYFDLFQEWLIKNNHPLITVIYPDVEPTEMTEGFDNLYKYCKYKKLIPSRMFRWCTDKFKIKPMLKYVEKPCFMNLGIDYGERHRVKINYDKGVENRFPLVEREIDRDGCVDIIKKHGLRVPMKSGCYICPYQKRSGYVELRRKHPKLFCNAEQLERECNDNRAIKGKSPIYICGNRSLKNVVEEDQLKLWKEEEYPPCECML